MSSIKAPTNLAKVIVEGVFLGLKAVNDEKQVGTSLLSLTCTSWAWPPPRTELTR